MLKKTKSKMIKVYKAVFGYKVKFHFSAKDQVDVYHGFVSLSGMSYYCEEFDQRMIYPGVDFVFG